MMIEDSVIKTFLTEYPQKPADAPSTRPQPWPLKATALRDKMDTLDTKLSNKIDALDIRLSDKIDGLDERLSNKIDALDAGAAGYLSKDARRAEIVEAVRDVARGKTVLPPGVAAGLAGEGISRVSPLDTVERGYSRLVERLRALGGQVEKIA